MRPEAAAGAGRLGRELLETPRLVLRELLPADLDLIAAVMADPEVMRFYPHPFDRDEARAWLDHQLLHLLRLARSAISAYFEYARGALGHRASHLETATTLRYEVGEKGRLGEYGGKSPGSRVGA